MDLLIITGPTASGKSTFAARLAHVLDGEIISADSMQIYRDCDIATAKPTPEEQRQTPHHLIDIIDPTKRYSAALWADAAIQAIAQITAHGKVPIIVGGTGFYLQALLKPQTLASVPPNPSLRADLEKLSSEALMQKLQTVDSVAAKRIDPANTKRVIRAIEVALGTKVLLPKKPIFTYHAFGLEWPRAILYERINARVDAMIAAGLLDELRHLIQKYGRNAPALDGIGYKEMLPVLDNPLLETQQIELLKRATRRYAKRQITWFRHQLEVEWLHPIRQSTEEMTEQVVQKCKK